MGIAGIRKGFNKCCTNQQSLPNVFDKSLINIKDLPDMTSKWLSISFCFAAIVLAACLGTRMQSTAARVVHQYQKDLSDLSSEVDKLIQLIKAGAIGPKMQDQFKNARAAYKKIEWLAEYYNGYTARYINGPALQEVEREENNLIIQPEGFQVIEEYLFPSYDARNKGALLQQASILRSNVGRLQNVTSFLETTDSHVFDAIRLEIFRITSLGISGFDSPIANNSIPEAASSVEAIQGYFSFYREHLKKNNEALTLEMDTSFEQALQYLSTNNDFVAFDRMAFTVQFLNPLSKKLLLAQQQLNIPVFKEVRALHANAQTLFAKNVFNVNFYTSGSDFYANDSKIALGKKLFNDPILSGNGKISCATCHQQQKAFTDGRKTVTVSGKTPGRNVPTLINAALQPALFYDVRINYLEDQVKEVINNKDEMHGSFQNAFDQINKNEQYKQLFKDVFNQNFSEFQLKNALASYVRSLIAMNSRFDQYMRGALTAMNKTEIDGFNLFMGKAKCGTCHFTPLFNGSNPPLFNKIDTEVVGVPSTTDTIHTSLDKDEGIFHLYKADLYKHQFKTPTLRNVDLTAPYMHNGVYKTLHDVVEFYNRGGGVGLGLNLENQTLPKHRLHLSQYEKQALVDFLKSLTDTVYNKP